MAKKTARERLAAKESERLAGVAAAREVREEAARTAGVPHSPAVSFNERVSEPLSIDERVAEVFTVHPPPAGPGLVGTPDPPEAPVSESVACFLVDARACQAVWAAGNAVSAAESRALVNRAVELLG